MKVKINRELNYEQLQTLTTFVKQEETTNRQHWSEQMAEAKDKKTLFVFIDETEISGISLKCRYNYANECGRIISVEII